MGGSSPRSRALSSIALSRYPPPLLPSLPPFLSYSCTPPSLPPSLPFFLNIPPYLPFIRLGRPNFIRSTCPSTPLPPHSLPHSPPFPVRCRGSSRFGRTRLRLQEKEGERRALVSLRRRVVLPGRRVRTPALPPALPRPLPVSDSPLISPLPPLTSSSPFRPPPASPRPAISPRAGISRTSR